MFFLFKYRHALIFPCKLTNCRKAQIAKARAAAVAEKSNKSGQGKSTSTVQQSNMLEFHKELMETCVDLMARYTFSTCASMPKRYLQFIFLRDGISVKPIYRHFLKYRLLVKVRTNKISAIGNRLRPNISSKYRLYFSDFPPIYR